ncbi:hypothetical protein LTR51_001709 [Lithohypha guttulata]|nr:hypothetical protein LTR51_001709 [Lithohypha guttulata]
MPTPIDRAMQSRNLFLGFAGLVAAASIWNMFGGDMFPAEKDPTGDPETWTGHELRRWLKNRDNYEPSSKLSRDELVTKVKAKMSVGSQLK